MMRRKEFKVNVKGATVFSVPNGVDQSGDRSAVPLYLIGQQGLADLRPAFTSVVYERLGGLYLDPHLGCSPLGHGYLWM